MRTRKQRIVILFFLQSLFAAWIAFTYPQDPVLHTYIGLAQLWIFVSVLRVMRLFKYNRARTLLRNGGTHTDHDWERIKARQGFRCAKCQRADVELTKDHIIPVARGGPNAAWNIQALCRSCNSAKGTQIVDYR